MKRELLQLAIVSSLLAFSSCTRTANRTGPLEPYPAITSDIEIGEQISGEGTRAELLGFIRWGDPGRASFRAHPQEHELGGRSSSNPCSQPFTKLWMEKPINS